MFTGILISSLVTTLVLKIWNHGDVDYWCGYFPGSTLFFNSLLTFSVSLFLFGSLFSFPILLNLFLIPFLAIVLYKIS